MCEEDGWGKRKGEGEGKKGSKYLFALKFLESNEGAQAIPEKKERRNETKRNQIYNTHFPR